MRELINPDVPPNLAQPNWRTTKDLDNNVKGGPCAIHRACYSRHPKVEQGAGAACIGPGPKSSPAKCRVQVSTGT